MISIQNLIGKEDEFFDLLEASAAEAHTSIVALRKCLAHPEMLTRMDEFITTRRKDKAITVRICECLCTTFITALERRHRSAGCGALQNSQDGREGRRARGARAGVPEWN
jgi:hypothetical protein